MPSVRDKASQFSLQRQQNLLHSALAKSSRNPRSLGRWLIKAPRRFDILLKNRRLGCPDPDMPRVGEEQVFVTREIASPRSPNTSPLAKNKAERTSTSDSDSARPQPKGDAEERGQDRKGSSASSRRDQTNRRSRVTHISSSSLSLTVSQPSREGRQAAETTNSDVKLSATSAANLDYHINQKLRHRKRRIVESLMDTIVECFEKKLDTLEEAREGGSGGGSGSGSGSSSSSSRNRGGAGASSPSRASSSGLASGKDMRPQAAGQKRHHRRDEGDEENSNDDGDEGGDDGNGGRKNHFKKKTKKMCDDSRPKFACPFYKFDPHKFKDHRTCLGPGWTEVHRVKEHLKRSHRLSPHQCHRCLRHFADEDKLKGHQRKDKPCAVRDPATVRKDLGAGFDGKKWERLQKRLKKTSEEKWKEWYCILFEVDASSSDVPSPYHDTPVSTGTHDMRDFYRERVYPMIRFHVDQEVERVFIDVEDDIKANIKDVIRDLPRRIMASIPPPPPPPPAEATTTPTTTTTNPFSDDEQQQQQQGFNPLELLETFDFDFAPEDNFNFGDIAGSEYEPLAASDSTLSSAGWSDAAVPSSATSLQDDVPTSFCLGV